MRYVPKPYPPLSILTSWQPVDQYPQLFAYPSDVDPPKVPEIMVIGGITVPDGNRWDRSRVDLPETQPPVIRLHAPSFEINAPNATGGWRFPGEVTGVSYGRRCCPVHRLHLDTSMQYILTSIKLATATVSGLGTYFLGLSSLSGNIADDDPSKRVMRLKQLLERSYIDRGNVRSLWNLADPRTCPPGTPPPGFQDGDEAPCGNTGTRSGNVVVAIPSCYIVT